MARGSQIIRIDRELKEFVGERVKKHASQTLTNLHAATPVDTGHARANWRVSTTGRPPEGVIGSNESPSRGSLARGLAQINAYVLRKLQPIIIANNVKYMNELNNGHSSQAPTNFIQAAVAASNKGR